MAKSKCFPQESRRTLLTMLLSFTQFLIGTLILYNGACDFCKIFVSVTTEVRGWIYQMQGGLNDLTDELKEKLGSQSEELDAQLKKAAAALEKPGNSGTKEDIRKSGTMNTLRRFLEECQAPESSTGKLLSGVKYAAGIVKALAGKYNKIVKWVALPQLPFGDS